MCDEDVDQEKLTYQFGPETTKADLSIVSGKVLWLVVQEGYGHVFRNMYMRSSRPVISQVGKIDKENWFYVEGSGYVDFSHAQVVVWAND